MGQSDNGNHHECSACLEILLSGWTHGLPEDVEQALQSLENIRDTLASRNCLDNGTDTELGSIRRVLHHMHKLTSPVNKSRINLNEVASERYKSIQNFYRETGIHFTLAVDDTDLYVFSNSHWLGRLLDSLVDNAVDELTKEKKAVGSVVPETVPDAPDAVGTTEDPEIKMTTRRDAEFAYWIVEDNGSGLDHEVFLRKINMPPEELENRGRGLFLAKHLIVYYQGELIHEETPNGTKICIRLPIHEL